MNILIERLSIDQLSKRYTGNLILLCFFVFCFTSHCDWFRKHESRMAFLLQEPRKKANCVCSTINSRVLLMFSLFCFFCFDFYDSTAGIVQKLRTLLVRLGSQLEHRIRFLLSTGAASDIMISCIVFCCSFISFVARLVRIVEGKFVIFVQWRNF